MKLAAWNVNSLKMRIAGRVSAARGRGRRLPGRRPPATGPPTTAPGAGPVWRCWRARSSRIRELSDGPLVVAGDFNVCPADQDVYDPEAFVGSTHVAPEERERFRALLEAGTVDAFRELHPDEPGFTWWDYRAGHCHKGLGLRIDAFLVSHPLAPRLVECGIDCNSRKGQKPSDHAPLLLELRD